MWRPPDWKNYIEKVAEKNGIDARTQSILIPIDDDSVESFEAGADAMLEALFKLARESPTKEFVIDSNIHTY